MKIRGIYVAFLVILLLLGAEGCEEKAGTTQLGAYIGGTDGIDISFVDEEPPISVLDNNQDPFFITVLVENMGEYTVPAGKIIATLSGINRDAFSMKSLNTKSFADLFGKVKVGNDVIEGGLDQLQFDQANYKYDLNADFATQLRADVCYNYQTDSLIKLCLKKNPIQRKQEDICLVNNENVKVENSGAPIQIKEVKSRGSSDSITFNFVVENKGSGEVYTPDTFKDSCILKPEVKDTLDIQIKSKSGKLKAVCSILKNSDTGRIKLISGFRTVSCNIKTTGLQETAFEEPIEINTNYFYKEAIGKDLTVVNTEY